MSVAQSEQLTAAIGRVNALADKFEKGLQAEFDAALGAANAGNYVELYVDNTDSTLVADDDNAGTQAKPLKTLSGVAKKLRGGKTHRILIMGESLTVEHAHWDFVPAGAVVVFDRADPTGVSPALKANPDCFIQWRKGCIHIDDAEVIISGTKTDWNNQHLFALEDVADFNSTINTKLTAIAGTTRKLIRAQGAHKVIIRGKHTNMTGNYFIGVAAGTSIAAVYPAVICNKTTG